jgi:transposase
LAGFYLRFLAGFILPGTAHKRVKQKGKRERDLAGLPVERIDYELPESERVCPDCGETMRDIGVDVRRELKLIPAKVVAVEHATHTYACRNCERSGIKVPFLKGEPPRALIPGSLASASLIAHIAVQKYLNGTPLYRIENGFRYDGMNISRQTMANWVIKCVELYLEPIYVLLKKYLLQQPVIHADETMLQVLHELGRLAQTKSWEWVYRTGRCAKRQIAIFEYRETRKQDNPREFLKDFKGLLHTDGLQAYRNLPEQITIVGCWVHVRRKFEEILKNTPKEKRRGIAAETGVAYITALFNIERELAELSPDARHERRKTDSEWIALAFFDWCANLEALPKAPIGQAVKYALNQREWLMNVYISGETEFSNNRCERAIRPFAIGRKAWLFSNTPAGARASSVMYSLIETAKANALHPARYLEYLLEKLPNSTTAGLEALLPWSESLSAALRTV